MNGKQGISFIVNAGAREREPLRSLTRPFSPSVARAIRRFHERFPQYEPTPLVSLPNLSRALGVAKIWVKDESHRFGLKAFKVLGATYALAALMAEKMGTEAYDLSFDLLRSVCGEENPEDITFVTATDGNHGCAVSWAAHRLGAHAVVYMPRGSSRTRFEAIQAHGAKTTMIEGNYDDAVRLAAEQAQRHGWVLFQDTALEGYEEIPTRIMQGYLTILDEAFEQLRGERPTHVFVQCGVGSLAASLQAYLAELLGQRRPIFVVVEAEQAACYFKSILEGDESPQKVSGELNTLMAGLACGEPSPLAWKILRHYADIFIACKDSVAMKGVRLLANPLPGDQKIISGESGAVTAGLITTLLQQPSDEQIAGAFRIDHNAKILLISTEGDTDPDTYRKILSEEGPS
jgi:diaminopropionate ammonia-lyase